MGRLREYAYIASALDKAVEAEIATVSATDPERATKLRDEVLFYVRQKHTDLLTQLAVCIQGYLAIDLVKRNNIELIKGVDRATTTTLDGPAHRGHRGPGPHPPEAGAQPDHGAQHHDREHDRLAPRSC